ncbi:cysteine-rich CWC family protein [Nitrospira sp. M1]
MEYQKLKSCSRCGVSFGCTSGHDCWCQDVSLTRAQLQWIESRYDNCLCPDCLMAVGQRQLGGIDEKTVSPNE